MSKHYRPTIDAPVIKIFVLETDTTHPQQDSFAQILHDFMSKAGAAHHPPLGVETEQELIVPQMGGRMPKIEEFDGYDGLLITGSRYDAHSDEPWVLELLELLRSTHNPP
jgi:GMP synthase-like glutamine amidotransferase